MERIRVVGCFLEYNSQFVFLRRQPHKPEGETWALPGGKVEFGESDIAALKRELFEETGYQAADKEIKQLGTYPFVSSDGLGFDYITYLVRLDRSHEIVLETQAHSDYQWMTIEQADKRDDLIIGLHELFRLVGFL